MGKFALECPHCGTVNKASTFVFAKKTVVCAHCKSEIDVKSNRMVIGNCSNCGPIAYDQAKGVCPICKGKIEKPVVTKTLSVEDLKKDSDHMPLFLCPECGCTIQAKVNIQNGQQQIYCPVCDHQFSGYEEILREMQKAKLVSETGVSVIKYEGDNQTFVWKHPIEDFNLGTQLIVHESQEAVFMMNGQALDLFGPGRYSLETENMPILKKVYDVPTGKQNPFHAEVYFINKTVQMGLKWGTDSRVHFIEPTTGLPLEIGASGEMNLQVVDSRKLLIKLVGTMKGISWGDERNSFTQSLRAAFRPMISTTVKSNLASIIKSERISIVEIDEKLESLSLALGEKISESFEEYGLAVPQFYVTNVALPTEDNNYKTIQSLLRAEAVGVREIKISKEMELATAKMSGEIELEKARIAAEKARIAAQGTADAENITGYAEIERERQRGLAEAQVMTAQGYNQKDVLQAEVQKAYAEGIGNMGANGGGGNGMMSDILGLGVGMAAMGTLGDKVGDVMKGFNGETPAATPANEGWECSCGHTGNTGKFCSECGSAKPEDWTCPNCGAQGNKGKFCSECGTAKPEAWDCPDCGAKGNKGKFCPECGHKKEDN